jgi:serine/threonine protein kinase
MQKRESAITRHLKGFSDHIHAGTFVVNHKYPVSNDYKLGDLLGRGSYGEARIGVHNQTGIKRAIKIISKRNASQSELDDIKTEISCLRKLDHPNIAKLYEVYDDDQN